MAVVNSSDVIIRINLFVKTPQSRVLIPASVTRRRYRCNGDICECVFLFYKQFPQTV